MAALSFSPSPPPTTTTPQRNNNNNNNSNRNSNNNNNNNNSKENCHLNHVKSTLGANKPFQKITVHNVLSESGANALQQHISNQNTIIRKIKDFGMLGAVHNAATTTTTTTAATAMPRKRPLCESKLPTTTNKPPTNPKRIKLTKNKTSQQQEKLTLRQQEKLELLQRPAGTPGRKGLPLPQAVARRNARERNRVKQVNNGFALLRERIPEEVSEAFEAQGAGRGASKKLSKVETLRMAVEYIRSLEKLLGFDFPPLGCSNSNSSSSGDDSFMFIKDEFDGLDENFDDSLSNYELEELPQQQQQQFPLQQETEMETERETEELLPSVTTLNGLQYVRIPGTSTYQLLTPDMLATQDSSSLDEEHFNALIDTNCLSHNNNSNNGVAAAPAAPTASNGECVKFASSLSRSPVPLTTATATTTTTSRSSTPATATTTATTTRRGSSSLHQPPSDAAVAVAVAVSPVAVAVANELLLQACAAQQQQQQQQQQQLIKQEYSEGDFRLEPSASFYDNVVVGLPSFKKEFTDVLQDQSNNINNNNNNTAGGCLSDESMIDAIDWWEAHTPKSDAGTVGAI
ncbi:hypothetical protein ACLKA6_017214 [Drosophila palustris]